MALGNIVSEVFDTAREMLKPEGEEREAPFGDAITILKADHREVEALFESILEEKNLTLRGQRENIAKVLAALTLHAKIEESLLYPAVYGKTKRDTDERLKVLEAYEEHASMKDLIRKIGRADARDESLKAKVQVLSELTKHHVTEEEHEFFREAREVLGEKRLIAIGEEIRKIKARAQKRADPKSKALAARKKPSKSSSRSTIKTKK